MAKIFSICKDLLSDDWSLWLICGYTRRNHGKLMIPNRLALKLVKTGYIFRDDTIRYKKNNVSSSSKDNLTPAVWEIATRAHDGNEHFAIFPEALVSRILKFAPEKGDWVLDPFAGRGTTV